MLCRSGAELVVAEKKVRVFWSQANETKEAK